MITFKPDVHCGAETNPLNGATPCKQAKGKLTDGVNAVAQIITLLAPVIAALIIRQQVTPTANPVLDKGTVVTVETPEGQPDELVTV